MMKQAALSICLVAFAFVHEVLSCGGGNSKCTYSVCTTSWTSWSPGIAQGSCRWQTSVANHNYNSYEKSSGCPGNTPCNTKNENRYYCSCKIVSHCRWGSWGAFTGSVPKGTCGTQRRYRYPQKTYSYELRLGSCNGAVTTCPRESDSQSRQWCNCRKAAYCQPTTWSSWAGHVANDQCAQQTSYRDFNPTYTYIEQENNCHGIQSSCNARQINSRSYCMCRFTHCVQQDWTVWTLSSTTTGSCPNEERYRRWKPTISYKGAFANCIGIDQQSCQQDKKEQRKKAITCPKLTSPADGTLVGTGCDGVNSACDDICQLDCKSGYPLTGNRYTVCGANGQWNKQLGTCKDSIPPTIQCPTVSPTANEPNENYAVIELPDVVADDQSGKKPTVTIDHTSPLKVTVGSPVRVTYTATDAAGNKKTCVVLFTAKDTEPPKIQNCPEDLMITTEKAPHTVIWEEPTFTDNVDASNGIIVKPNHRNGQKFYKGTTNVVYNVHDSAFNQATCEFKVQVSELKCNLYDAPKHGAYSCNINKNGVEELYLCSIACKANHWFVQGEQQPKLYDFYVCGDDGGWKGQNQIGAGIPTFFEAISKGSTPWPDCAEGAPPSEAAKPFTVIGGSCTAADIATLKTNFITALISDPIITSIYCQMNAQNCVVKNVKVYCSTAKKRSTGQASNTVHISFEFYVQDKFPSKNQNSEMTKMTRIISSMSSLGAEVKRVAQSQLKASAANIILQEKSAELACEAGFEFSIVNGTGSKSDRSKCVKCPAGTKYVASSKKCEVCPQGSYQDLEGQSSCKQCPQGFSTHGYGANNYTSCKKICSPGTYSSTGLATCLACPKGLYQARSNSTSCMSCPSGKGTAKTGAVSEKSCAKRAVHVTIRSEGCDDPRTTIRCGSTSIKVDGVDRSTHKRGYNLVVLNGNTGAFEKAASFDTHGKNYAGANMLQYVKNSIVNGKIVLVGIQDEGSRYATQSLKDALTLLKGLSPFQTQYRAAFAMLGYKGNTKPSWVRQKIAPRYRGPALIDYNIPLM